MRKKLAKTEDWQAVVSSLAQAEEAINKLKALGKPFLNWASNTLLNLLGHIFNKEKRSELTKSRKQKKRGT